MKARQKNIKKFILSVIFFIILLCINSKVNATSISISPSNPKVGDTVTVTVTISNVNTASLTANVSGVANGTIKVVGGDLQGNVGTYSNSERFYCSSEGTLNVSISSDSTAVLNGAYVDTGASASVKVSPKSDENNNNNEQPNENNNQGSENNNGNNGSTTTNPTQEPKKSNNANLVNLGITPNDFKGFKSGTTSYDVTVPNDVEKVTVYAKVQDTKAKITSGTGTQKLKVGKNTLNVEVTAEDGTKKTYTINVTREEEKVTTNETNTAPEETSKPEENNEPQENKTNFDLSKLEIAGYTLTPKFSPDVYEYTLKVNSDVSKLDIKTEGINDKINIEIAGNEDLVDGENTITILVYNEETKQNTTYQIIVDRANVNVEEINPTLNDAVKKANKVRYILLGILLFIVVAIIIFVIVKRKYNKKDEMYDQYEYDEEDQERLNLDEEEEFFKRLNKQRNEEKDEKIELSNKIIEENEKITEQDLSNPIIQEKQELEEDDDEEEFFRTSKSRKRGKHF